jgi:hypothetical protein
LYVGDSYAAAQNDLALTYKEWSSIKRGFKLDSERILCDRAWTNVDLERIVDRQLLVSGHVKPRGKQLEHWEVMENNVLGHYRGLFCFHIFFGFLLTWRFIIPMS